MPVGLTRKNVKVGFAEVMRHVRCMLHDGGFEGAGSRLSGREVLGIPRSCRPGQFTHIAVGAGNIVSPCTRMIVDDAIDIRFLQLVLWMNKMFAE